MTTRTDPATTRYLRDLERTSRMTGRDVAALWLLELGGLLLGIGWLVGLWLLWTSDRWRRWEKLLGTLVVPGGVVGVALTAAVGAGTMSGPVPCPPGVHPDAPDCSGGQVGLTLLDARPGLVLAALSGSVAVALYLAACARPGRAGSRRGHTV